MTLKMMVNTKPDHLKQVNSEEFDRKTFLMYLENNDFIKQEAEETEMNKKIKPDSQVGVREKVEKTRKTPTQPKKIKPTLLYDLTIND